MLKNNQHFHGSLLTLGKFELTLQHQTVSQELNYEKARLLLTMLAMAKEHKLDRSTLADSIWEEVPSGVRRARLRHALHILKQALNQKHPIISTHKDSLLLDTQHIFIDALFVLNNETDENTIIHKLTLYQGSFLNNFKFQEKSKLYHWQQQLDLAIETNLALARSIYIEQFLPKSSTQVALQVLNHCKKQWPHDNDVLQAWQRLQTRSQQPIQNLCRPLQTHAFYSPQHLVSEPFPAQATPLGIMAIKLHPKSDQSVQLNLALLQQQQHQALQLLASFTSLITLASATHLLAYYIEQCEPNQLAHTMHRAAYHIQRHMNNATVSASIGIHMAQHTSALGNTLDAYSYHAETALMLSWQAHPNQILISSELAAHLPHNHISSHCTQTRQHQLLTLD